MTEVAPPDVKRRRLSTADTSHENIKCIDDLPSVVLTHVASYLDAPSRALFAASLSDQNAASASIVDHEWSTLDFGDIEKDLVVRLTDDDISAILMSIDAGNKLKRLKLTNCVAITGAGLEPLRGSLVIQQIDLSLVGNESPDLDPEPPISCQFVLPIFDSIIEREGCALMHLHFPSVWQKEPSSDSEFHAFIVRYNQMRRNRGTVSCLECNESLPGDGDEWIKTDTPYYGTHLFTCYDCLKYYCYYCEIGDDHVEETLALYECATCRRDHCKGCSEMTECSGCTKMICNDCYKRECANCQNKFCSECVEKGESVRNCDCDRCYCQGCFEAYYDDEAIHIIDTCSRCDVKCCDDCGFRRYLDRQLQCTECIKERVSMDESLERKQLQDEVKQLKVEMEELKRQIEELKLENEELRSNVT